MQQTYKSRQLLTNIAAYVVLGLFGLAILFPFLFMFFTSLKLPTDVFTSPPRLLPYTPVQIEVPGNPEPQTLYNVMFEGQPVQFILGEEGIRIGVYATVDNPGEEFEVPLKEAKPVGGFTNQTKVTVNGEDTAVWEITANGQTIEVIELRRTAYGRFEDPNDPSRFVVQNVRTTRPVERLEPQWGNFGEVLRLQTLDRSLTNTMLVTILVVLGQVVTSILGGFAFARMEFPGRNGLFLLYLGTLMVPFVVLIVPMYQVMVAVGWVDRMAALIIPWVFSAYGTFLMRQFFLQIPKDLEEAAFMDGASRFRILWQIFVPLAGPAIATQATFSFLYAWNSFVWPYIVINTGSTQNHVLTLSLMVLQGRAADSANLVMAGAAIAVVVPFAIFVLAQRFFVEGIATSGLK